MASASATAWPSVVTPAPDAPTMWMRRVRMGGDYNCSRATRATSSVVVRLAGDPWVQRQVAAPATLVMQERERFGDIVGPYRRRHAAQPHGFQVVPLRLRRQRDQAA